jgi:hypothetical protein
MLGKGNVVTQFMLGKGRVKLLRCYVRQSKVITQFMLGKGKVVTLLC